MWEFVCEAVSFSARRKTAAATTAASAPAASMQSGQADSEAPAHS